MRLSTKVAAERLGVTERFVRNGLKQGVFPWGYAVRMGKRYSYYINADEFGRKEQL